VKHVGSYLEKISWKLKVIFLEFEPGQEITAEIILEVVL